MSANAPNGETRWIEIDLSDVGLPAEMPTLDEVAEATTHVYERFTPFADEGWEWVQHPASDDFDGWVYRERDGRREIAGVRLFCRRADADDPAIRPLHGLSAYRTRQLTARPWTAEPGSKAWRPFAHGPDWR